MNTSKLLCTGLTLFFFSFVQKIDFSRMPTHSTIIPIESEATNIIFQSTDNGKSWQDISKGLPGKMENYDFFANDKGLYMPSGNEMYYRKRNASAPNWNKEFLMGNAGNIKVCRSGVYAVQYEGKISKKIAELNIWIPVFSDFKKWGLRTIFETSSGAVLIGCDSGLFKTIDDGKTWKHVLNQGWVIKIVEADGVLIATNQEGIIRSTDDGENWNEVVSEGGVGIDVASINGGFAAITYNTASKTRRVRTSYDSGKTWQAIDAGLPAHDLIANIIEVGEFFFCGHPKGIYRSADKGKTWELIRPSIGEKVFNLSAFGNVIYAFPKNGGC